ncbi:hypothetical protein V7128_29430 [Neobacillus vireti]|uniref:hypothetical protein n=1 Tax=Neobacillus vireti TaxID=220686 RepID=UPI002FFECE78
MTKNAFEKLLWSIALPGFGQILNQKYIKGLLFIFLEFLVNIQSNFNVAIISSFHGNIDTSIEQINFKWLMFYPCLYFFSMWDAVKDANRGQENSSFLFLPFVFATYFVTIGLIYLTKILIFGVLLGPVFLPMLFVVPGVLIGLVIRKYLTIFIKIRTPYLFLNKNNGVFFIAKNGLQNSLPLLVNCVELPKNRMYGDMLK